MDPIFSLPAVAIAVAALYVYRKQSKKSVIDNVEAAKKRADERALKRQWADTMPMNGYDYSIDFSVHTKEIDDTCDGRGPLSPEENKIVNTLLAGLDVDYVDDLEKFGNVFSRDNKVESVDPWATAAR